MRVWFLHNNNTRERRKWLLTDATDSLIQAKETPRKSHKFRDFKKKKMISYSFLGVYLGYWLASVFLDLDHKGRLRTSGVQQQSSWTFCYLMCQGSLMLESLHVRIEGWVWPISPVIKRSLLGSQNPNRDWFLLVGVEGLKDVRVKSLIQRIMQCEGKIGSSTDYSSNWGESVCQSLSLKILSNFQKCRELKKYLWPEYHWSHGDG